MQARSGARNAEGALSNGYIRHEINNVVPAQRGPQPGMVGADAD
jgi:hypothetical protein